MWDLTAADEYIRYNTLDNEDWLDSEEDRKIALLNVSKRTLERKFSGVTIVDDAIYLFANALSSAYNDTMVQSQRGVASFSIDGLSFTFKDWAKTGIEAFIPDEVYDMLGVSRQNIKYITMG